MGFMLGFGVIDIFFVFHLLIECINYNILKEVRATNAYRVHEAHVKNNKNFGSLFNFVIRFQEPKCYDIWDKFFGILSIAFPRCCDAVSPGYSNGLAQAMVRLLQHHLTHHRPLNKP